MVDQERQLHKQIAELSVSPVLWIERLDDTYQVGQLMILTKLASR